MRAYVGTNNLLEKNSSAGFYLGARGRTANLPDLVWGHNTIACYGEAMRSIGWDDTPVYDHSANA